MKLIDEARLNFPSEELVVRRICGADVVEPAAIDRPDYVDAAYGLAGWCLDRAEHLGDARAIEVLTPHVERLSELSERYGVADM